MNHALITPPPTAQNTVRAHKCRDCQIMVAAVRVHDSRITKASSKTLIRDSPYRRSWSA